MTHLTDDDFELIPDGEYHEQFIAKVKRQAAVRQENDKRHKIATLADMPGMTTDKVIDVLCLFMPNCKLETLKRGLRGEMLSTPEHS